MQPQLRRIHRMSWRVLAVLLPLAFFGALFTLQPPIWAGQLVALPSQQANPNAQPETANYLSLSRQKSPGGGFQVEARVQQALPTAAALLYLEGSDGRRYLLGKLGSRYTYTFAIDSTLLAAAGPFTAVLMDPLKNKTIQTLKLP